MVRTFGAGKEGAAKMLEDYESQKKKYEAQSAEIQHTAEANARASESAEQRALRYDIGEGLLEIGLVLSSLYFIARRKMFPAMGLIGGAAGAAIAFSGLLAGG